MIKVQTLGQTHGSAPTDIPKQITLKLFQISGGIPVDEAINNLKKSLTNEWIESVNTREYADQLLNQIIALRICKNFHQQMMEGGSSTSGFDTFQSLMNVL